MIDYILAWLGVFFGLANYSDLAQDIYGFRALLGRLDPYPPLAYAHAQLGLDWPIVHASTHPPTAYLLTAPVALLPWPVASALWAWLMLAALVASLRCYGLQWRWVALVVLFCLNWNPFIFSLGQLTPLWLLGAALAYQNKDRPFAAGCWVAVAALTKFFPALLLLPFLARRQWRAAAGFALVWLAALLLITALHPGAIPRYVGVNLINSTETIARLDNAALLPNLYRFAGWPGLLAGLAGLAGLVWYGRHNWHTYEFLAVALLPIAWIYSLLPLLPGMIAARRSPFVLLGLLVIVISPAFGGLSVILLPLAVFFFGLALSAPLLKTPAPKQPQKVADNSPIPFAN